MMRLINQMMKLPLMAFVYSMEMFAKTMRGLQELADQGIDAMVDNGAQAAGNAPESGSDPVYEPLIPVTAGAITDSAKAIPKEERNMPDTNLSDDMLKLVRYKILFVKRDYEVAFPEVEELVPDNTTATAYTGWKIAEFIQRLDETKVPKKWMGLKKDDPPKYPEYAEEAQFEDGTKGWAIHKLKEDDKKYLRVYFEVLDRYTREKFRYEERQIEVLEEIRDKMTGSASASGLAHGGTAHGSITPPSSSTP